VPAGGIAILVEGLPALSLPLLPLRRHCPGATSSTRVAGDPHTAHCGAATIPIPMQAIVTRAGSAYPGKQASRADR
jgi:hypothetical protein